MSRRQVLQNSENVQHLRKCLEFLMQERKLDVSHLAAISITPVSTITRLLAGKIQNPSTDTILSLAKGLEVTTTELLGEAKSPDALTLAITANNRPELLAEVSHAIAVTPLEHHLLGKTLDIIGSVSFVANKEKNIARLTIYLESGLPEEVIWDLRDTIKRNVEGVHRVRAFAPEFSYETLNPEPVYMDI